MSQAPVEVAAERMSEVADRVAQRKRRIAGTMLGIALVFGASGVMMLAQVGHFPSSERDISVAAASIVWTFGLVMLARPSMRAARRAQLASELARLGVARFYVSGKLVSVTRDGVPWPDAAFAIDGKTARRLLALPRATVVK